MPSTQTPIFTDRLTEDFANLAEASSPVKKRSTAKITIADVAREAGVSTTAVSHAFSGKGRIPDTTRQVIFETATRLGYEANYYAQRIKGGCTKTIACFSDTIVGVSGEKVTRIQQEFIQRGFSAPLYGLGYNSSEERAEAIKQLRLQRPRAIVFGGTRDKNVLDELRKFQNDAGIVVCYDNPFPPDFEQVELDRELDSYHATRHLIEQGHRKIGISTHSHEPVDDAFTRGFNRALKEAGLAYRAEWNCPFHPFELAGKALAAHFVGMPQRPTAFYVVDDRMATTFVTYLVRGGLHVPEDVAVITHDQGSVAEHCIVPLTVVSHPVAQIVNSVVSMVESRMDEEYDGPPRHTVISGALVERDSVRHLRI